VVRKPAELFFPVSGALTRRPPRRWRQYEPIFREHSTALITAELLAALAQARARATRWQAHLLALAAEREPFDVYKPPRARSACTRSRRHVPRRRSNTDRGHAVVEDGPWDDWSRVDHCL